MKHTPKNPASYTAASLELIAGKIQALRKLKGQSEIIILDPMAGSGKVTLLQELIQGLDFVFLLNDLEKWAHYESRAAVIWTHDDAANLQIPDNSVDLLVTSPTYGNRMADSHKATDVSDRVTYTHRLGKPLADGNPGRMPYGKAYCEKHIEIFKECFRVMKPGGTGFFVMADFIRQGKRVHVTDFVIQAIKASGFSVTATFEIEMRGMRKGRNGNLRVGSETIIQCKKREKKK